MPILAFWTMTTTSMTRFQMSTKMIQSFTELSKSHWESWMLQLLRSITMIWNRIRRHHLLRKMIGPILDRFMAFQSIRTRDKIHWRTKSNKTTKMKMVMHKFLKITKFLTLTTARFTIGMEKVMARWKHLRQTLVIWEAKMIKVSKLLMLMLLITF